MRVVTVLRKMCVSVKRQFSICMTTGVFLLSPSLSVYAGIGVSGVAIDAAYDPVLMGIDSKDASRKMPTSPEPRTLVAEAQGTPELVREAIPVVLRASDLSASTQGQPNSRLSLLTYRDAQLVPIPFQIDEMDETGLVFANHKKQAPLLGLPGVFDGEDELLFMLSDAAPTPAPLALLQNYQVLEVLQVGLPAGETSVVYLVLDDTRRSSKRYVSADLGAGHLETDSLKLTFNPQAFSDISAIQLKDQNKQLSPNILDDLKLEVSTGILNKNVRVSAALGKEITLKPLKIVTGPVRSTLLLEVRFRFLGVTLHRDQVGVNFYRRSVNVPTRFTTSSLRSARLFLSLLREPRIEFDVAFGRLQGAMLNVDSYATPGRVYRGEIDGQMSDAEQQANQETLPGDYIWLASGQGWHSVLTNTLPVVPQGLFDSFLAGLDIRVRYHDVADPRDAMRASVAVEGIPKTALDLLFEINRLGLDRTEHLEALLARVVDRWQAGKLKRFDRINQGVIEDRITQGLIKAPADYVNAFIEDLDRISLRGVERNQLNLAIRRAMQPYDSLEALRKMELGPAVAALQREAQVLGLDLSKVLRAGIDNTIWFAQSDTAIDPLAFYEAASHLIFTPQVGIQRVAESSTLLEDADG